MKSDAFDRKKVAALYLEALELGLSIVSVIEQVMNVDTKKAKYLIRSIRASGLVGKPPHVPIRATISRGSNRERTWIVCDDCLVSWPCPFAHPRRKPREGLR